MSEAILNTYGIASSAGEITVYNYDAITREYLSSTVEYLAKGVGVPAHSCTDKPGKFKAGFAICRNEDLNGWEYVEDHREAEVYKTDTGEKITVRFLGELPENTTTIAPETQFDVWNGTEWITDIDAKRVADVQAFEMKIQALIDEANAVINKNNWPSKLQLNRMSETETSKFNLWLDYIDALNAIKPSDFPTAILPEPPSI
ncbi:tail fiber assembly protein [Salmonella enterica]|nr:tail fiber assembly protein [Salmonella enterica]EDU4502665.1 tail fiber assembly protein [Salmonella enterica]EDU6348510.1 tail fiber assembly protein [Salmonella enterica]EDX2306742.1 tail fiber assembly protein [Salmonella enterica]EFT4964561.1 tail fiber assembly protein [Salmonella enterica]